MLVTLLGQMSGAVLALVSVRMLVHMLVAELETLWGMLSVPQLVLVLGPASVFWWAHQLVHLLALELETWSVLSSV
jgi:hypothetical protein